MTVSTTTRRVAYTGDGATVAFTVPFKFLVNTDLAVYLNDVLQSTGYTVAGAGATTGTVTFVTPPAALVSVVVLGNQPNTQQTIIPPSGPFPAVTVETMADKAMIGVQQLEQKLKRSIVGPPSDSDWNLLVSAAARVDKLLGFNATTGQPEMSSFTMTKVASVIAAVYAAAAGPLDSLSFLQSGAGAVSRSAQAKARETVSVKDFGAVGDGVTNDRPWIKAAVDYLKLVGGGKLIFPDGADYLVSGTQQVLAIPEVQADLSIANSNYDAQLYWADLEDVEFEFHGSRIVSDKTNGGVTLCLDGARRVRFSNLNMLGATVMAGSTIVTAGTNGVILLSRSRDSYEVSFRDPQIAGHFGALGSIGDPAAATRVSHITISGAARLTDGDYGLFLQNNGDHVVAENIYSLRHNRPIFWYGVDNVRASVVADAINGGFQSLVKAYSRNTTNIDLRYIVRNRANNQARLGFQSQHNPATQPTPATVERVRLYYDEDSTAIGGTSILFDYFQNAVSQATAGGKKLFDGFEIQGKSNGDVTTTVTLANAFLCSTNMTNMVAGNGADLLNATGFAGVKKLTYSPALTFGGAAVGMTYTLQSGEYYIEDGDCHVVGKITLSAKGSSVGAAKLTLPITSRLGSSINPLMSVLGFNMSGLTAPVQGWVTNASVSVNLVSQGAASPATLTDTSFTDTTTLMFHICYPV